MQRDSHQQASLVPPKAPSTWGKQLNKGLQQPFGLKLIWSLDMVVNTLNRGPREVEAGRTDMVHSQPWAMTRPCLGGGINLNQSIFLSFLSSFPLFDRISCIHSGIKLAMRSMMTLSSRLPAFISHLWSCGFIQCWGWNPGLCRFSFCFVCQVFWQLNETHNQPRLKFWRTKIPQMCSQDSQTARDLNL